MCAEEKENRRVQKKREQSGKKRPAFLPCLLVICMLVIFTDNAAKTVKATEVAPAEVMSVGSEAAAATEAVAAAEVTAVASEAAAATEAVAAAEVTAAGSEAAAASSAGSEAAEVTSAGSEAAAAEASSEENAATATEPTAEESRTASEKTEETAAVTGTGTEESRAASEKAEETAAVTGTGTEECEAEQAADTKIMYLTFDDGPSAESTEQILDILKERNIKATFFVIGENVRKHPETARRIVEEGHTIGIHCDVHDYETLYESVDSYVADFEKAYDTVLSVTGVEAKIFRFPGGSVNAYNKDVCDDIIAEMEARGFVYFDWNASVEDATGGKPAPEELVQNAVDTSLGRKRVILLAHDRVENTALALDALIDAFPEYRMEPLTAETAPIQF